MFKRFAGIGILTLIAATPFVLMTRPALANNVTSICYVGNGSFKRGIVIEVDYDVAENLVNRRKAFFSYAETFRTWRGHTICLPLKKKK